MADKVFGAFLDGQERDLADLCGLSSRLRYRRLDGPGGSGNLFAVEIACCHLIKIGDQPEVSTDPCVVAITFPAEYLRMMYPPDQIMTLIEPRTLWHPNARWPFICPGDIAPGTGIIDLILRSYDLFTYNRFNPDEKDCLNPDACSWVRQKSADFPLERRPLRDLVPTASSAEMDFELQPGASR